MSLYGLHVTCLHCAGDTTTIRDCVHHPARRTSVHICKNCGAEFALQMQIATITAPPPPPDHRARRYRDNKKAAAA